MSGKIIEVRQGTTVVFTLKEKLKQIVSELIRLEMKTEQDFNIVTQTYAQAKSWEKQIDGARKEANEPDQSRINERNDAAKSLTNLLKSIIETTKAKTAQYQDFLEAQRQEQLAAAEAAAHLLDLEHTPYVPELEKSNSGSGAMAFTRILKKFRVIDAAKVPAKYLKIDDSAVELDIKLGISDIPGIEIYEEKVTQLRTK